MKVDRRCFLGLGLGAVAGAVVSPPGVKLTDDLAIWTQNWPWTPVPKDGKVTYEQTTCSLCKGNCGIRVRKVGGRPVHISGQEGHPVNDGGACLHGISGLQYLYGLTHINAPLKMNGDKFEEMSWKEAVSHVAEKLNTMRENGEAEKLACITGRDRGSIPELFKRFMKAYGSPHYYSMPDMNTTWRSVAEKMHGRTADMAFDLENATHILSFGTGMLEGWGSPVYNFRANAQRKDRGVKLVQVEPRLSNTAAGANRWVPALPGSEADLALAMCSVIMKEKLYDSSYLLSYDTGFSAFSRLVTTGYTPEKMEGKTGVPASTIKSLAREFAKADRPLAVAGKGRGDTAGNLREFAAVHAMNCLVGNINAKGGVWLNSAPDYLQFPKMVLDEVAEKGSGKTAEQSVSSLIRKISESGNSPVKALLMQGTNLAYSMHDTDRVKNALEKVPFKVSFSSYMDETAQLADIILPSPMFLERYEDLPSDASMSRQVVGLSVPVQKPLKNTMNPGDAVIRIAKAMENSVSENFPWKKYEDCLEKVTGKLWESLSDNGYAVISDKKPGKSVSADLSFFSVNNGQRMEIAGDKSEYPLMLVPYDNMRITSSDVTASPFAVKTVSDEEIKGRDSFAQVNPETARKIGVSQGDKVQITTPAGSAAVRIDLYEGLMPGLIGMPKGLGHTLDNPYVAGKGVNTNELISVSIDPNSGQDAAFGINAKISRV